MLPRDNLSFAFVSFITCLILYADCRVIDLTEFVWLLQAKVPVLVIILWRG